MTFGALNGRVLSDQRIARPAMIEIDRVDLVPAIGVMAGSAIFTELADMRVGMAGAALGMHDAFVLHVVKICCHRLVGH